MVVAGAAVVAVAAAAGVHVGNALPNVPTLLAMRSAFHAQKRRFHLSRGRSRSVATSAPNLEVRVLWRLVDGRWWAVDGGRGRWWACGSWACGSRGGRAERRGAGEYTGSQVGVMKVLQSKPLTILVGRKLFGLK